MKKTRRYLYILFMVMAVYGGKQSQAQNIITLRGQVSDSLNSPLPEALVQTGQQQTRTDAQGRFSLSLSTPEATLRVSYVGYQS